MRGRCVLSPQDAGKLADRIVAMVRRSSATPTDAEAAAPKGASNDDDPAPYIALVDEMRRDASITGAEATLLVRTGGGGCRAWVHVAAAAYACVWWW